MFFQNLLWNSVTSGSFFSIVDLICWSWARPNGRKKTPLAQKWNVGVRKKQIFRPSDIGRCFCKKNCTNFGQLWPPQPCLWFTAAYRGLPPFTIFPKSRKHINIVQLCTRVCCAIGNVYCVHQLSAVQFKSQIKPVRRRKRMGRNHKNKKKMEWVGIAKKQKMEWVWIAK